MKPFTQVPSKTVSHHTAIYPDIYHVFTLPLFRMSDIDSLPDLVPAQNSTDVVNDPLDTAIRSLNDASNALRQAAADFKMNNKYDNDC